MEQALNVSPYKYMNHISGSVCGYHDEKVQLRSKGNRLCGPNTDADMVTLDVFFKSLITQGPVMWLNSVSLSNDHEKHESRDAVADHFAINHILWHHGFETVKANPNPNPLQY